MSEIQDTPVEDLEVEQKPAPSQTKIGSEEFCKALEKLLSEGDVWRRSKTLADKLEVDPVALHKFLQDQQAIATRPAKEEGMFLYALINRLSNTKKEEKPETRPVVSEEDRYVIASLHSACLLLDSAMNKYAMKIHSRNTEAFTLLADGKDKIEAGLYLFGKKVKADLTKLPKL